MKHVSSASGALIISIDSSLYLTSSSSLSLSLEQIQEKTVSFFQKRDSHLSPPLSFSHTTKFLFKIERERERNRKEEKRKNSSRIIRDEKDTLEFHLSPSFSLSSYLSHPHSLSLSLRMFLSPPRSISFCVLITSKQEEVHFLSLFLPLSLFLSLSLPRVSLSLSPNKKYEKNNQKSGQNLSLHNRTRIREELKSEQKSNQNKTKLSSLDFEVQKFFRMPFKSDHFFSFFLTLSLSHFLPLSSEILS